MLFEESGGNIIIRSTMEVDMCDEISFPLSI